MRQSGTVCIFFLCHQKYTFKEKKTENDIGRHDVMFVIMSRNIVLHLVYIVIEYYMCRESAWIVKIKDFFFFLLFQLVEFFVYILKSCLAKWYFWYAFFVCSCFSFNMNQSRVKWSELFEKLKKKKINRKKTCISKNHSGHNNCLRAQTCSQIIMIYMF